MEKIATLNDLETAWSYDDVERAIAVLRLKNKIESISLQKAMKK